jgi:hypothetical protein
MHTKFNFADSPGALSVASLQAPRNKFNVELNSRPAFLPSDLAVPTGIKFSVILLLKVKIKAGRAN